MLGALAVEEGVELVEREHALRLVAEEGEGLRGRVAAVQQQLAQIEALPRVRARVRVRVRIRVRVRVTLANPS